MNLTLLTILDHLLTLAHILVIGFNLTGWMWRKTRVGHRWMVGITAASWFLLGPWYGWGYCFLTDWHWQVKRALGETGLPGSFIKYMADKSTGGDIDSVWVDMLTLVAFVAVIGLTVVMAIRDRNNPVKMQRHRS